MFKKAKEEAVVAICRFVVDDGEGHSFYFNGKEVTMVPTNSAWDFFLSRIGPSPRSIKAIKNTIKDFKKHGGSNSVLSKLDIDSVLNELIEGKLLLKTEGKNIKECQDKIIKSTVFEPFIRENSPDKEVYEYLAKYMPEEDFSYALNKKSLTLDDAEVMSCVKDLTSDIGITYGKPYCYTPKMVTIDEISSPKIDSWTKERKYKAVYDLMNKRMLSLYGKDILEAGDE